MSRHRDLDDGGVPLTKDECEALTKIRRQLKAQITAHGRNARVGAGTFAGSCAARTTEMLKRHLAELDDRFVPEKGGE